MGGFIQSYFPNHRLKQLWLPFLFIFLVTFLIYCTCSLLLGRTGTPRDAYFHLLADAFLHGRLFLINPPSTADLTFFNNQWYVAFPPLPAVLLTPIVALLGPERVNTVLFVNIIGALNTALVYILLYSFAKITGKTLSTSSRLWVTALFGFGTVHWYVSTLGQVWFISQVCTVTFVLLATISVINRSPAWVSGLFLGLAMFARPNIIFCYPLLLGFFVEQIRQTTSQINRRSIIQWILLSILPIFISSALLLGLNFIRFGNFLDFGYQQMNVNPRFADDLLTYGQFNLHYVSHNLQIMLLATPTWVKVLRGFSLDPEGMSILITTPALLTLYKTKSKTPIIVGAWAAFGLLLIPIACYYTTGWMQFGYRFCLDLIVPLIILFASTLSPTMNLRLKLLILLGVIINAWGVSWYLNPVYF
jgi:hypothetical protein